ncbi:MAG: ABC transporter permease [Colwellia sp.]|nr:ABC transporter permease [Colwellia sp.]
MFTKTALAAFKRAKQYYLTTVFTLAITLSMVLSVFSLVDLVFFAPLPYNQSENLYVLEGGLKTTRGYSPSQTNIHVTNFIRDNNDVFTEFASYLNWTGYKLYDLLEQPNIRVMLATENLFDVLGVEAELGRLFNKTETVGNKQPSVVLGYRTWQTHYQGDKDIIGKKIQLNQRRFTVIGIAPDNLVIPYKSNINDAVWIPLDMDEVWSAEGCARCYMGGLKSIVRLKEDPPLDLIAEQLNSLAMQGAKLLTPDMLKSYTITTYITPVRQAIQGDSGDIVLMLLVGVSLLMAIALINLSSMQLARAVAKIKTVAISFAFGASSKQLLVESLKHNLVVIGLAVGLALLITGFSFSLVQDLASGSISRLDTLGISLNTVLFSLLLTAGIALLYSYLELKVVNEQNLMTSLQSSGKGVGKQMSTGASHLLIGLQVTFSFMVLVASSHVVLDTLSEALRDKGVETKDKWSLVVDYSQIKGKTERVNIHKSVFSQLEKLNSVKDVKAISESKFPSARNIQQTFDAKGNYLGSSLRPRINAGYIAALGLEIIGSDFGATDHQLENYPVLINQRLADKISTNTMEVVGTKISFDNKTFYTVKGVVENTYFPGRKSFEYPEVYVPAHYKGERKFSFLITATNNELIEQQIREVLVKIDSRLEVASFSSLESQFSKLSQKNLSAAWIAIILASVSLLMVCIGINGIVNYMVQVRRYDLGVKLAMGADNKRLLKDSLMELMQPVVMSLVFAFSLGFMLLGYSKIVPEITLEPNWLMISAIWLGFALLSLLVSFIPVRQVLAKDPIKALRNE